jgi:hypothetical protein
MIKTQSNYYDSSTIDASSYDFKTGDLFISFNNLTNYVYKNVSEDDYLTFTNDKSQGISLNNVIKGKYEYEKIEDLLE